MSTAVAILLVMTVTGQTGTVAYIAGESQAAWQLMAIDVETGITAALGQGDRDAHPQWSPDGRRIAYQSKTSEGVGIRIVNADGGSDTALEHRYPWNHHPCWSPDGQKLAYRSEGDTPPLHAIVVYDMETGHEQIWGGEQRGLDQPVWLPSTDLMKALDPDDTAAAEALGLLRLQEEADEHGVLLAVGITGSPPEISTEVFILTPSHAVPLLPFLIPDSHRYVKWLPTPDHRGRQIAYESNEGGDRELFVLGRRGIANVSNHPAADWNPVWSPDTNWLVFESFRSGRRGIYRVLVTTGNVLPVVVSEHYDCWDPAWSPDGRWIVFASDMTGRPQLHVTHRDGTNSRQLTHETHAALAPAWRPKTSTNRE